MNLIILGPQASGKGTQADILAEKLGLFHFEMGGALRQAAKKDPTIDKIVNQKGGLVSDEVAFAVLAKFLKAKKSNLEKIIFDGFPRNLHQYQILSDWLKANQSGIDKVIFLDISDEEIARRLSGRRTCILCGKVYNLVTSPKPKNGQCQCGGQLFQREDDKPEIIKKRLEVYQQETKPLLAKMAKEGNLIRIAGGQKIAKVTEDILKQI